MKRQIGIILAVWLIASAFLHADTSYLLIQGPFGMGGSTLTYKWKVNYPTGYLVTGQDLLDAVFGTPVADGAFSDPVFGDRPYFAAGNSKQGAGYLSFFGSFLSLSFTLNSTLVTTNDATPLGTSTVGWNYYVAGGSGEYGGTYADTGAWMLAGDGQGTRFLSNGSFDGFVYGNTGYDAMGNPATTGSTTAVINDTSGSDDPSDFSNNGPDDVFMTVNVTLAGEYTLLLSATDTSANIPQATGYAVMRVGPGGGVILAGRLPGGKSFSASSLIVSSSTANSQIVIEKALTYPSVKVKGSSGFLFGTLTFVTSTGSSNLNGTLEWVKPEQTGGAYRAAIDTNLNVIGSVYVPPEGKRSALPGFTSGILTISDTNGLILSGTTKLTGDTLTVAGAGHDLTIKLNPANGVFNGSFISAGKIPVLTEFGAVLFQDQTTGGGLFFGPEGSGTVTLSP